MSDSKEKHYPKTIDYTLKRTTSIWFAHGRDLWFPEVVKQNIMKANTYSL